MRAWWFAGLLVGLVVITAPLAFVMLTALSIGPLLAPFVFAWIVFIGIRSYRASRPISS